MGYRSDVVLVMYAMDKKDYPTLQVWFSQFEQEIAELDLARCFKTIDMSATCNDNKAIVFEATDTKWYDSYAEVKFINWLHTHFRNAFQNEGTEDLYNYEFIRIGEDTTDIEEDCGNHGFNLIGVSRVIIKY